MKFGELMQSLSTEIGIAKDHQLNETDNLLLALYTEAFRHYQVSGALWQSKISASDDMWNGEIPIYFEKRPDPAILQMAGEYGLPVSDRTLQLPRTKYKSVPADSVQRVWKRADESVEKATAMFYGKELPQSPK